ncbi:hypothetical protein AO240_20760 [Pseudomonas sp. ICMP 460]|nr:hypothetical protein AO240_20760 [Pseudomonas sp. ICMP 460]
MNYRVDLPEYKKVETVTGLVRIQFPEVREDNGLQYKHIYSFDMSLKTISTGAAKLTDLARSVTHIIRRETVSIKSVDQRRGWAKLFKRFEVPFVSAEDQTSRRVELRVEAKPTLEEIKEIIDQHAAEHDAPGWEDTGFITDKSGKTVWAGSFRISENISVDDQGKAIIDSENLFRKILENRDRYISPIIKDNALAATGTDS